MKGEIEYFWLAMFAFAILFILLALIDDSRIQAVLAIVVLFLLIAMYKIEKAGRIRRENYGRTK